MTTPEPRPQGTGQPSVVPGVVLLGGAAVLIIVVLINPDMPGWLRTTIAIVAVVMVLLLLVFAVRLFRITARGGRR
ncbi:hypothetical protein GIS00_06715 [Nakamurella sp. YIM 132087]|uniref:Uncharacterized protein n=1 Tax=Nakamurella alba TaxID=2665158 RepID=A0A7K1FL78_9ACTN|nr:hypothetical protein [Nakamurella alba]MTD13634.1 hypothetical protein [Nakamurella alba]